MLPEKNPIYRVSIDDTKPDRTVFSYRVPLISIAKHYLVLWGIISCLCGFYMESPFRYFAWGIFFICILIYAIQEFDIRERDINVVDWITAAMAIQVYLDMSAATVYGNKEYDFGGFLEKLETRSFRRLLLEESCGDFRLEYFPNKQTNNIAPEIHQMKIECHKRKVRISIFHETLLEATTRKTNG